MTAGYELIITEKPSAAKKIADALADGKAVKKSEKGVPYYDITRGSADIIVASAAGHLFTMAEKDKGRWTYPVFSVEWVPTSDSEKSAAYLKKYLNAIKRLAKQASSFTIATDYDIEGEVIGLNILRYACKQEDGQRMKFSTLTKDELVDSYRKKSRTIDWGQANAGIVRHELDWYYGINLSRALTLAIKRAGRFKIMSSGRVQGPALKIIVDREEEIRRFRSKPFWQLRLLGTVHDAEIEAWHRADKFWKREEAEDVLARTNGKDGTVARVERKETRQAAPHPFDLTTLQVEAYRALGISPKLTLELAQELYVNGWISYPRTSSQQLPASIGYQKILSSLARNDSYRALADKLLQKKPLRPNNGKKTDPAHPAIYPTGIAPRAAERQLKLYDLIVKRFLATFGQHAVRETMTVDIDVAQEVFVAKGTRTTERGWHAFYEPYVNLEEAELPKVKEGDSVEVRKIDMLDKETQPPKRYTAASIIKELEKRNLGTKATRAQIVETLISRGYILDQPIKATDFGIHTVKTLRQYCPSIIDEKLTRHFEMEMEEISQSKKKNEEVLDEAKALLTDILRTFREKEKSIGESLLEAHKETEAKLTTIGRCQSCGKGTLVIKRGKFGRFIACDQYPECKETFKLPATGLVKPSDKPCPECSHPQITIIKGRGRRPQLLCLNHDCPSKKIEKHHAKEAAAVEAGEIEKGCPKCRDGKLLPRKSVYGQFYGCSRYPKCRYTENIGSNNRKKSAGRKG